MWDKLAAPSRVALRETALCKQEISSNSALQHPTPPTLANPPLGTIFSIRDGSKLKNGISQRRKHRIRPILLDNCWTNSRQSTAPGCKPQYSAYRSRPRTAGRDLFLGPSHVVDTRPGVNWLSLHSQRNEYQHDRAGHRSDPADRLALARRERRSRCPPPAPGGAGVASGAAA